MKPFVKEIIEQIFKLSPRNPMLIGTNEGITIEYKLSFGWKSISDYLKAMASFANRDGGYIVFGIKDRPHELCGLQDRSFEDFQKIDNMLWSTHLREHFSPEINWERSIYEFVNKKFGLIYTYPAINKPVICKKDAGELKKSAIYYRYNSQNSEIDYPELVKIIEDEKNKIHEKWMALVKQIGDAGITKTALLDLHSGKMTGPNTTLYMDKNLLDEISFVQEGSFVETGGDPALIIKGQVQTVVGAQKVIVEHDRARAINSDDILLSFIIQDKVDCPNEFIKQICYQTTGNLPVYYYMQLAKFTTQGTIDFLNLVPINSNQKELLKRRIINRETKYAKLSNQTTKAAKQKRLYYYKHLDETLIIPDDVKELRYFIVSLMALDADMVREHKNHILNLLYKLYDGYFNNPFYETIKNELRYAICWIDEALYMELNIPSNDKVNN